jgi:hypothetical protein
MLIPMESVLHYVHIFLTTRNGVPFGHRFIDTT